MITSFKKTIFTLLTAVLGSLTSCSGQQTNSYPQCKGGLKQSQQIRRDTIALPKGADPQAMFRCSFKDKEGNMWFGTTGTGLYKWDSEAFVCFTIAEELGHITIYSITENSNGQIWIATDQGVFFKNGEVFMPLHIPGLEKAPAYCILGDRHGNVWFVTENKGLWRYDGKTFKNYVLQNKVWIEAVKGNTLIDNHSHDLVQSLLEDRQGNIWISGIGAPLSYYDGRTFHALSDLFEKTTTKGPDNTNLTSGHIFQFLEDQKGNIWMATRDNGICRYNGQIVERFSVNEGVANNGATCIYEDPKGNIWFGSLGIAGTGGGGQRGLTLYDGMRFRTIPTSGMRNNQVWTLEGDNAGNIWIGTKEFGLYRYDGKVFAAFTTP
jgi:ligand-binding sensor domain-containing protein